MSGYTKLFHSILASTIWREDTTTRVVWITLLAMADKDGIAEGSVPGLADFARVSVEDTRRALSCLMAPDSDSRSQEHEGRRIEAVEGGWRLLNHAKYRAKMGADERREYNRAKVARWRAKRDAELHSVTSNPSNHKAEADTDPKAKSKEEQKTSLPPPARALNGRSKRPIFTGQRLTIFEWQLDDLTRTLGPHADNFDLHEWFFALDSKAVADGLVVPKRDGGEWLQSELLLEARRRGLPLRLASAKREHVILTKTRDEEVEELRAGLKREGVL